jgi:acetolactate synthase-1/2/3 large subunit
MRGVQAVAAEIARQGVREAFTYMSRDIIKLLADVEANGIKVYQSHHEQAAVGMADGYARTTGRTGVAFVGAGVGLTNCINALVTAAKAHSRIIVFVGEVPGAAKRSPAAKNVAKFVDQQALLAALSIRHVVIQSPADIEGCFRLSERLGEALVVSVPTELIEAKSTEGLQPIRIDIPPVTGGLSAEDCETVVELLMDGTAANRTVILAGRGAMNSNAGPELTRLGVATGALIATSAQARGLCDDSPYSVGISGTFATPVASELLGTATLVLVFGASLNNYTTYNTSIFGKARFIHIDDKPAALGKYQPVDLSFVADARIAAGQLADALEKRGHRSTGYRTDDTAQRIASFRLEDTFKDEGAEGAMDPRTLMTALNGYLPSERIVACDAGNFMDFSIAHVDVKGPRSFVWPIEYTAVGSGLGPALGAAVAHPDRLTIFFVGDGGAVMSLADLHTAVRYGLKLLIVICNDGALSGELHFLRENGYKDDIARSENPEFESVARGLGFDAATITKVDDLGPLRERLQNLQKPMLLDCRVTPEVVGGSRDVLAALIRKGAA